MLKFELNALIKSVTKEFSFDKSELDISAGSIEYSLGYGEDQSPDPVKSIIENVLGTSSVELNAKAGFRIFNIDDVKITNENFSIHNQKFICGKIIAKQLINVDTFAIFTATIGAGVEMLSKELMSAGDMLEGYVWDAYGSEAVERVCDKMEIELKDYVAQEDYNITNRYSPGYCGWDVSEQHKLFSLLPNNFCGITLTKSSLMIPIKSVSGVIGIGKRVRKTGYQCSICDIEFCIRRIKDRGLIGDIN